MIYTKITTYVELKPEHHVGEMSLTLCCKPSERHRADLLLEILRGIDGWEWSEDTSQVVEYNNAVEDPYGYNGYKIVEDPYGYKSFRPDL